MRSCFNFIKEQVGNKPLIGAEIGVERGGNAANILENLNITRLYLIDSWEGKFRPLFEAVKSKFRGDERVIILKNSSLKGSKKVTKPLDFVYIDGDHSYKAVKQDIEVWSEKVKVGGFVCGHDYMEERFGVRKAVLEYCSERRIYYLVQADGKRVIDGTFYCNWWFQKCNPRGSLNRESYIRKIGPMDLKVAKQILLEIKEILDRRKINFYLSDGVMLGAIRNKSFIPGDDDIDLRILVKEWDFSVLKDFEEKGFWCVKRSYPNLYQNNASRFDLFKRGIRTGVGLNYYYPPEDLSIYLSGRPLDHATVQPAKFYRGDHFIEFLGARFRIPYPPEEYLEALYDKDWRTPTKGNGWKATRKPISIAKYAKYFIEHPEVNQKQENEV